MIQFSLADHFPLTGWTRYHKRIRNSCQKSSVFITHTQKYLYGFVFSKGIYSVLKTNKWKFSRENRFDDVETTLAWFQQLDQRNLAISAFGEYSKLYRWEHPRDWELGLQFTNVKKIRNSMNSLTGHTPLRHAYNHPERSKVVSLNNYSSMTYLAFSFSSTRTSFSSRNTRTYDQLIFTKVHFCKHELVMLEIRFYFG